MYDHRDVYVNIELKNTAAIERPSNCYWEFLPLNVVRIQCTVPIQCDATQNNII